MAIYLGSNKVSFTGRQVVKCKEETLEGVDFINVDKGVGEPIIDMQIKGNSSQITYTGKNLIWTNQSFPYTMSGLTVSRNSDGSINVKGTSTLNSSISLYLVRNVSFTLKAGTYTLNNTGTTDATVYLLPTYSAGTFTLETDTTFTGCYIHVSPSAFGKSIDFTFFPQLEDGTKFTGYEPYVGGVSSPNPEYPQEIESVGDKTSNLYNIYSIEHCARSQYNLTNFRPKIENNILYSGGISGSGEGAGLYFKIKKNTNYKIFYVLDFNEETETTIAIPMYLFNEINEGIITYNYVQYLSANKGENVVSFNSGDNEYFAFMAYSTTRYGLAFKNIYLGEGIEYEPYGYKVPVKASGKNLFNATQGDFENAIKDGEGKRVVFKLKPNTEYTLSTNEPNGSQWVTNIWFNGTSSSANGVCLGKSKTTTTDENGELYITIRTTEIYNIFNNCWLMLEEGTEATDYEPYIEPVTINIYLKEPLRKLGGISDYIDYKNKRIVRNIGVDEIKVDSADKISFTGQSWQRPNCSSVYFTCLSNNSVSIDYGDIRLASNMLKRGSWEWSSGKEPYNYVLVGHENKFAYIIIENKFLGVSDDSSNEEKKNAIKTFFDNNKAYIFYVLLEPTQETIDIAMLFIDNKHSKVVVDTEVPPSKMTLSYWKNIY